MVDFQPTINLGTILHLLMLLTAAGGLYWKIGEKITNSVKEFSDRLARLETKVDALWREFLKNGNGGS